MAASDSSLVGDDSFPSHLSDSLTDYRANKKKRAIITVDKSDDSRTIPTDNLTTHRRQPTKITTHHHHQANNDTTVATFFRLDSIDDTRQSLSFGLANEMDLIPAYYDSEKG